MKMNKKGFTLIELLAIIVILAIITSLAKAIDALEGKTGTVITFK